MVIGIATLVGGVRRNLQSLKKRFVRRAAMKWMRLGAAPHSGSAMNTHAECVVIAFCNACETR